MSSSEQVYNRLITTLQALVPVSNRKQLVNWAWLAVAIFQAQSVALSQIAVFLPGSATAASRVMRLRRWLSNEHCSVWTLYRPLLLHVLAPFAGRAVYVVLDGTLVFGNRMQIFRLSLVHKNRAIPLVWKVLPGKGNTSVSQLKGMLTQVAEGLNESVGSVSCWLIAASAISSGRRYVAGWVGSTSFGYRLTRGWVGPTGGADGSSSWGGP